MRSRRAFSLLEVMVAMGLFLMIIGLVATLMRGYAQMTNASDRHDRSLETARLAVESMRADIEAAVKLQDPVYGSSTPQERLSVLRVDAEKTDRLPLVPPDPLPANWNPYKPANLVEIVYEGADETLWRQGSWADGTVRRTAVGFGLAGFSVRSLADETVIITMNTVALGGNSASCRLGP